MPILDISTVVEKVCCAVSSELIVPVYVSVTIEPPSTWNETSKFEAAFSPKFVIETVTDSPLVNVPEVGESILSIPISYARRVKAG